jgi:TPR repeat protein
MRRWKTLTVVCGIMLTAFGPARAEDTRSVDELLAGAAQGDITAQARLGWIYQEGQGVTKDPAQAAVWYRRAAEQGDAVSQNNLGSLYAEGRGVKQDFVEAAKWYRKAADHGVAMAQNSLGNLYQTGRGVAKDPIEATQWFHRAAQQGLSMAQINLGELYFRGEHFAPDWVEAYKWFYLAAAQGDREGARGRDQLARLLRFEQIAEAKTRAASFTPKKEDSAPSDPEAAPPRIFR